MSQQQAISLQARHPLSVVFLLHIALEAPMAFQGLLTPGVLPFLQLNNTALVFIKLYAALVMGACIAALLCFSLPEYDPGKRALALGLCLYHVSCSTILYYAPRFIPMSLGPFAESYRVIPETIWGTLHGFMGLGMAFWFQATVMITRAAAMHMKQA